jgi:hypothetical protein
MANSLNQYLADFSYWLLDAVPAWAQPGRCQKLLQDTAARDGKQVKIGFGQDPGQAGQS